LVNSASEMTLLGLPQLAEAGVERLELGCPACFTQQWLGHSAISVVKSSEV
jgi:hypothetical protein